MNDDHRSEHDDESALRPDAPAGEEPHRPGEWRDVLAADIIDLYRGQHIAIVHKRVVAAGESYEEVLHEAEAAYPTEMPYIAYIPKAAKA